MQHQIEKSWEDFKKIRDKIFSRNLAESFKLIHSDYCNYN